MTRLAVIAAACLVLAAGTVSAAKDGRDGRVVTIFNQAQYTYVEIETGPEARTWVAAPHVEVVVGDKVHTNQGQLMKNYHSKSLDRTFPEIYFVNVIRVTERKNPHAGLNPEEMRKIAVAEKAKKDKDKDKEQKRKRTVMAVADVYRQQGELNGQTIRLKAKVFKFSPNISGKNWLQVVDPKAKNNAENIIVTTQDTAADGQVVMIEGVLSINKPTKGMAHALPLLVENATVRPAKK